MAGVGVDPTRAEFRSHHRVAGHSLEWAVFIPIKFIEKEAGLETNVELLGFPYWLRGAAMDCSRPQKTCLKAKALTPRRSLEETHLLCPRKVSCKGLWFATEGE